MFPIPLQEPTRGINLVKSLHDYMNYHNFLLNIIPITADIFVFFFPILLIILYIIGIKRDDNSYKESALRVFRSAIFTTIINVLIQFFFKKARPISMLLGQKEDETLLHSFLPNSSFPSDHSAMSMGFAIGLLIRGIKNKNKKYTHLGIIFLIFALITGFSRIMVGVHWPTDILGGFAIGIIIPIILSGEKEYKIIKKIFITPLISLQNGIWKLFGKKQN